MEHVEIIILVSAGAAGKRTDLRPYANPFVTNEHGTQGIKKTQNQQEVKL